MPELTNDSIDCTMTSPPYWGLRDYGDDVKEVWGGDPNCEHQWDFEEIIHDNLRFRGATSSVGNEKNKEIHTERNTNSGFCLKCGAWYGQLGLEPTFQLYLDHMMIVCSEIKRVLKKTGSFWLNMGDTYGGTNTSVSYARQVKGPQSILTDKSLNSMAKVGHCRGRYDKCLIGIPWRLVLRLIDEQGWILRNATIWHKPNSMPSSVKDRCSNSYEFLFHLVKNTEPQYYWNKKTGLMIGRKPLKAKQIEDIDWEWRQCSKCNGHGEIIKGIQAGDNDYKIVLSEKGPEICPRCKGTGKIKHSFWHSLGYWYDLDAIREPHKDIQDYQKHAPFNYRVREAKKGHTGIIGVKSTKEEMERYDKRGQLAKEQGMHTFYGYSRRGKQLDNPRGKNPGDVWTIPTQPRPEAHFATFPDKLCIKPILATCPAEVCSKCGKARVRITKVIGREITEAMKIAGCDKNGMYHGIEQKNYQNTKAQKPSESKKRILQSMSEIKNTIGWTDCGCNAGWDSGVLLDPFAGKGTALIMAKKMGRYYVGYELKKEYYEKLIKPSLEIEKTLWDLVKENKQMEITNE